MLSSRCGQQNPAGFIFRFFQWILRPRFPGM
ncbi:unnamed protein product, partial [marine sediment metagenome]